MKIRTTIRSQKERSNLRSRSLEFRYRRQDITARYGSVTRPTNVDVPTLRRYQILRVALNTLAPRLRPWGSPEVVRARARAPPRCVERDDDRDDGSAIIA